MVLGTPNHSGELGEVYGVMLHGTRSGIAAYSRLRGDGSEGRRTVKYCRTPGTTSYGWIIDYDGTINELTGYGLQAWHGGHAPSSHQTVDPNFHTHARGFCSQLHMNVNWLSIGFAQVDVWEPLTDPQYVSGGWLLGDISRRLGTPLVRLSYVSTRHAAKGVVQHQDTGQGRWGGKSDIGPLLDYSRLGL